MVTDNSFDLLCLGGGSGGIATAVRAAKHGARVGLIESHHLGGTCVNVGCVPKKMMWYAAHLAERLHQAADYGFDVNPPAFAWSQFVTRREAYIERLRGIYEKRLNDLNITLIRGHAHFKDSQTLTVNETDYHAKHIVIATGTKSTEPQIPGGEYTINSDGFFALDEKPKRVAIIGAGYIAVELAGVLHQLGCDTTLCVRYDRPLRHFDPLLSQTLLDVMQEHGPRCIGESEVGTITKEVDNTYTCHFKKGHTLDRLDCVIWAAGRTANIENINLTAAGVEVDTRNFIVTDSYQNTSAENIYALGDVSGRVQLTPVAIAAGRRLANRLFASEPDSHLDYDNICTVIFSHPPIGTVGLSEPQAIDKYGKDNVTTHQTKFVSLFDTMTTSRMPTAMKLVTVGEQERIVGIHVIGNGADEMLQGFGVALKMGALKKDFDATVAIHPTSAEELVTMGA